MNIQATSNHRVEIHQSDIVNWFEANKADVDTAGMRLLNAKLLPDTALSIAIPVSENYLDAFLRSVISGLPAIGQYEIEVLSYAQDIVGVITWNS